MSLFSNPFTYFLATGSPNMLKEVKTWKIKFTIQRCCKFKLIKHLLSSFVTQQHLNNQQKVI